VRVYELIVDPDREEHIARHDVRIEEVEEIIFGRHVTFRSRYGYYGIIGRTDAGRYLTIIVAARRRGVYSLVTARAADEAERRLYQRRRGH